MNKFKWGKMNEPEALIDFYNKRTASVIKIRNIFARLAKELIKEEKNDSAIVVLDRIVELMPDEKFPYDFYMIDIIKGYYDAGANIKGKELLTNFWNISEENLSYYLSLKKKFRKSVDYEIRLTLQLMQECLNIAAINKEKEMIDDLQNKFKTYYDKYSMN